jgi:DNA-binding PadR family transcriptional regulator
MIDKQTGGTLYKMLVCVAVLLVIISFLIKTIDYSTICSILMVTMKNKSYVEQVVEAWEEEYKKGLLTFWILLALHQEKKHVREIKQFIEAEATTNLSVDEKSVYRSVGRLRKMDLLSVEEMESPNGGPKLKLYGVTKTGEKALSEFYQRNINSIFITKDFQNLTKGL